MTVVGLIFDDDESAYKMEVKDQAVWYQDNNLSISREEFLEESFVQVMVQEEVISIQEGHDLYAGQCSITCIQALPCLASKQRPERCPNNDLAPFLT
jgi:hypothetical protein